LEAKALVGTLTEKPSETKADKFAYTLGHVNSKALLDTLAHTPAKLDIKKPADTLCDVKAFALVATLAYMLTQKKKDTCGDTRRDVVRDVAIPGGISQKAGCHANRSKGQDS